MPKYFTGYNPESMENDLPLLIAILHNLKGEFKRIDQLDNASERYDRAEDMLGELDTVKETCESMINALDIVMMGAK